jgi:hypothetical protein
MHYRSVDIEGATLVANSLAAGSHLVRFHSVDGDGYRHAVVVTETDEGRTLFLQGWIGSPLPRETFLPAMATLFPAAMELHYQRRRDDGTFRDVKVPL